MDLLIKGYYYSAWRKIHLMSRHPARCTTKANTMIRLRMRGSRKFCQRGSNFDFFFSFYVFFLFWLGEERSKYHYKRAINGPPAKRHLNGVSLAGRLNCVWLAGRWWPNIECWTGSFVILRGRTSVAMERFIFVIFQGGGPDPLSPLDSHMLHGSAGRFQS